MTESPNGVGGIEADMHDTHVVHTRHLQEKRRSMERIALIGMR